MTSEKRKLEDSSVCKCDSNIKSWNGAMLIYDAEMLGFFSLLAVWVASFFGNLQFLSGLICVQSFPGLRWQSRTFMNICGDVAESIPKSVMIENDRSCWAWSTMDVRGALHFLPFHGLELYVAKAFKAHRESVEDRIVPGPPPPPTTPPLVGNSETLLASRQTTVDPSCCISLFCGWTTIWDEYCTIPPLQF